MAGVVVSHRRTSFEIKFESAAFSDKSCHAVKSLIAAPDREFIAPIFLRRWLQPSSLDSLVVGIAFEIAPTFLQIIFWVLRCM